MSFFDVRSMIFSSVGLGVLAFGEVVRTGCDVAFFTMQLIQWKETGELLSFL